MLIGFIIQREQMGMVHGEGQWAWGRRFFDDDEISP